MYRLFLTTCLALLVAGCGSPPAADDDSIRVVATTTMLADLARTIGGDAIAVDGLMGAGVDPHMYKASEGDVLKMAEADLILYNGLHLEGRMGEVLEQMSGRGTPTVALADAAVPEASRLASPTYTGSYDPHVWFDVQLWKRVAQQMSQVLVEVAPDSAAQIEARAVAYIDQLDDLDAYVRAQVARIPEAQRVLITSHDAFGYFGAAYGFDVRGLQGLSTATEAGTADVQNLATFVAEQQIPAMFVESSVSSRGIEAVQAAVRAKGFDVQVGGSLYSDALGSPGTLEGTYLGTIRHNIDTLVAALAPADA
ncbi:MAG: zinc ABC transporter substrate-binding protein [Rhodothermales bacterium]